ncbi:MAG: FIST N-terminal domain-containing protein [Gaiellaceae bacterium]
MAGRRAGARRALVIRVGTGLAANAAEAAATAAAQLGDATADLAFVFLSGDNAAAAEEAVAAVHEQLAPRHLVGCVADGVLARDTEVEAGTAAAVWAASLPGAEVGSFHATTLELEEGTAIVGFPQADRADLVALIVDPYTFPADAFLEKLNEENPGTPLVGGVASGRQLLLGEEVIPEGAVGAVLSGVPVRTLVSQGCAPIGRDAVVTAAEENVIYELAGERALDRLRADVVALDERERALAATGLLVGLVIDENKPEYGRGDYLIRGLVGADEDSGAIAVGAPVRVGQTVRFHVRDGASADDDLRQTLAPLVGGRAAGALLFTCNGRGTNMFPEPGHDARLVTEALGAEALAGFFCGGEIGPVGGRAFLHGFTATLAVFLEE